MGILKGIIQRKAAEYARQAKQEKKANPPPPPPPKKK